MAITAKKSRNLIYITKVDLDELSGQATFERGLLKALNRMAARDPLLKVFALVPRPKPDSWFQRMESITPFFLPTKKKRPLWYVLSELAIGFSIFRILWIGPIGNTAVFVRYNASMMLPPIICWIFRLRLVFRSGPVFESLSRFRGRLRSYEQCVTSISVRLFCYVAKSVIVVTEGIGEWFIKFSPASRTKIVVIPNAADPDELPAGVPDRAMWNLRQDTFVLGFVGSMVEEQGVQTVLRALPFLDERIKARLQLLLVGDGPAADAWRTLGRELGVEHMLIWSGKCPRSLVPSAMASSDVMLLPVTREVMESRGTSAIKLFEYLSCDKFILASRGKDFMFLEQENVGQLVEADNPKEWASAITNLVERPIGSLNGKARALVERKFNYDRVAEKVFALLFSA